ncbi:MAG TPA: pilus assembly protein N-terminal domain-containing protein [Rhizomicrobium sp.]
MRCFFAAALIAIAGQASAATVTVAVDTVQLATFHLPMADIHVADPAIADANMIDARHVFVLGKVPGATTMIARDAAGHVLESQQIIVVRATKSATPGSRRPN